MNLKYFLPCRWRVWSTFLSWVVWLLAITSECGLWSPWPPWTSSTSLLSLTLAPMLPPSLASRGRWVVMKTLYLRSLSPCILCPCILVPYSLVSYVFVIFFSLSPFKKLSYHLPHLRSLWMTPGPPVTSGCSSLASTVSPGPPCSAWASARGR